MEENLIRQNKKFLLVTQNVDGLHRIAGSKNIIEIHGSLHRVKCSKCGKADCWNHPICDALDKLNISADFAAKPANLSIDQLPQCHSCSGLLRPDIVWFGESLDAHNLETAFEESKNADLILVIGTSSQVYPVAMIAPDAADLGIPVIEINLDTTPKTDRFMYHFHGKSGEIIPLIVNQMESD